LQAVEMYTDLCQFDRAKEFASSSGKHDVKNLITKQAEWAKDTNDPRAAW
jgi:intraflagellar transport protein 122